jgi:Protein of unknown function (DUF3341)
MEGNRAVVGVFSYLDDTLQAISTVKESKLDYRVYAPVPLHEIEEATFPQKSPIRFITATGAILGVTSGFALAILCSMDYPMRVSAKDVVSPPGFFVIGYECTILFGAIFTLLAMFHYCRLPDLFRKVGYDPRFSQDKFGVVVGCSHEQVESVKGKLKAAGAEEVSERDGL